MAKMLVIHANKCTGCVSCELACEFEHGGEFRHDATRIHVYKWEAENFSVPMMCQQCNDAACVAVCTPHALTIDAATGLVNLDQGKCIGCKMCVQACPFGGAVWDQFTTKVLKCDTCGGDPACAAICPTAALEWVDDSAAVRGRKLGFAEKFKEAFAE